MTVATDIARVLSIAWIAGTIIGVPFLSTSESPAARRIRRIASRTFRRFAR